MGKSKPLHQPPLTKLVHWWCSAFCFLSNLHLVLVVAKWWYSHLLFWLNKMSGFTAPYPPLTTAPAAAFRVLYKCKAKPCIPTPLRLKRAIWSHCTQLCSKDETLGKTALGRGRLVGFSSAGGIFFFKREGLGTLHRDVGLFLWEGIHALKLNTGAWFFSPHLNNRCWTASLRQWQLVELKQIGTWQRENPRKCQFWGSDHVVVSVSFEKKIYLDEVQQLAFSNHQGILDLISCNTSAAGLIPPAALENPSHWRYMLFLEKNGNILPAL